MERIITDQKEKNWAMLTHVAAFSLFLGIPFGNIIGPLIIYLIKKNDFEFVAEQGRDILNFQITWTLIIIISGILIIVGVGVLMLAAFGIAWFVLVLIGTITASNGNHYKYPLTIDFIKSKID